MSKPLHVSTGEPVVIDTSVAFKWFDVAEGGVEGALSLARQHQRDEIALVAPAHLPLEILNVLVRRRAEPADIEMAARFISEVDLLIAPVNESLLVDAARIAAAERLTLYDAVFIALAAQLDAELVTADRRQGATRSCRVRMVG